MIMASGRPGPFFVVAAMPGGWRRLVLSPDGRALLFDDEALALHCARGVAEAGIESAEVADLPGGDEALVGVLDRHGAEPPCSFELELVADLEPADWGDAARGYGLFVAALLLRAYRGHAAAAASRN